MKFDSFIKEVSSLQKINHLDFGVNVVHTSLKVFGVTVPAIKEYAKKLAKENVKIEDFQRGYSFETDLCYLCLSIEQEKTLDGKLFFASEFMKKADSWAMTDTVMSCLKIKEKDYLYAFSQIRTYLKSRFPFVNRFGYILFLANFIKEEHVDDILPIIEDSSEYYVRMAIAWLISVIVVKCPSKGIEYLKYDELSPWTHNKAISKANESYRIDNETKLLLKQLKK